LKNTQQVFQFCRF